MTARQGRVFVARKLPNSVPDLISDVRAIIAASKRVPAAKSSNPSRSASMSPFDGAP